MDRTHSSRHSFLKHTAALQPVSVKRYLRALCATKSERLPHACYGNRGVSGIEGTNATALRMRHVLRRKDPACDRRHVARLFSPDNGPFRRGYRSISSWSANDGGGIFRFIRTTRDLDIREEYLRSRPYFPQSAIEAYGWKHLCAENEEELRKALHELYSGEHLLWKPGRSAEKRGCA